MFKRTISDDAIKVIKTLSYTEGGDSNNWRVVIAINNRHKLLTESVDYFVAELKTLAKTCNFCDCLRNSLIRDRIVLGIKDEQDYQEATENSRSYLESLHRNLRQPRSHCGAYKVAIGTGGKHQLRHM